MIKKAVIPAAGYGTRFLPITKVTAKEMLPIIDRPTLQYIIEEAVLSGITEICLVISPQKKSIMNYFKPNKDLEEFLLSKDKMAEYEMIKDVCPGANISYVYQHEQLGLGHAVLCAKEFVGDDDFAVLLGDDVYVCEKPAISQLISAYEQKNATILGTQLVPIEETSKYGICIPKYDGSKDKIVALKGVIEKPKVAPSQLAISGRYVLKNHIFSYLKSQTKGAGGEIQLTDAILRSINSHNVFALEIQGLRYDIGSKIGFIEATIDFALKRDDIKDDLKKLLKEKLK